MKKILYASFEAYPFIKTGGLADMMYGLPLAICKDFEVKVCLPLHKKIKDVYFNKLTFVDSFFVDSSLKEKVNIYSYIYKRIEYLFIENDEYFGRFDIYGFDDDNLRFSFFCLALIKMLKKLNYYPDIIHSNDYHTALIPALTKYKYKMKKIKHIYTIHNLAYQGNYDKRLLFDYLGFDNKYYFDGTLRFNDECNFMKIGITCADIVTTVSNTYAKEILSRDLGCGLDMVLKYRSDDLYGVVNGVDKKMFNPSSDEYIKYKYNIHNFVKYKALNKKELLNKLHLKDDGSLFIGVVSRLTYQKGFDLLIDTYKEILRNKVKIVVLGSGETRYEYAFKIMEKEYSDKVRFLCTYDEKMAHEIYAGCDMFLMPSLFEPCGLGQLIAMRYGTLPLVRETGGLLETVEPYNEFAKTGRGFSFGPYNSRDLLIVFNYAYKQYMYNQKDFKMLIRNAMRYDSSFKRVGEEYVKLYSKVLSVC